MHMHCIDHRSTHTHTHISICSNDHNCPRTISVFFFLISQCAMGTYNDDRTSDVLYIFFLSSPTSALCCVDETLKNYDESETKI